MKLRTGAKICGDGLRDKICHCSSKIARDIFTRWAASAGKSCGVNDVLITNDGFSLDSIPSGSTVGSSSLRRAVQISRKRPDLNVKPIRGNIETRINKVTEKKIDGIVLAKAGISRLGVDTKHSLLSKDEFLPSPGQGALAIICTSDDSKTIEMLKKIEDKNSRIEVEAERSLSEHIDSGCRFPVGAYASVKSDSLILKVGVYSMDGKKSILIEENGTIDNPFELGKKIGNELKSQGVSEIASNWREKLEEWNKQWLEKYT